MKKLMRSGNLYNETNEEVNMQRRDAKKLSYQYNQSCPTDVELRQAIIHEMFGSVGSAYIEGPIQFSYGKHVFIGKSFYANFNLTLVDDAHIYIGNNVMFGPNVVLSTAGHPEDKVQRRSGLQYSKDIHIGDDVWLGSGVIVHPGVSIGSNTIIGSGSVVTKDMPKDSVCFGVPCRVERKISDEQ